ncbi:hypothetical protein DL98DRAFT_172503 [Cadophora sp. DSE1049]|nr:hypothetical protein DL98DRAFT_172503 [Cadophora sp. DSE1049]
MHMVPGPSIARRKRHSLLSGPSHPTRLGKPANSWDTDYLDLDLDQVESSDGVSQWSALHALPHGNWNLLSRTSWYEDVDHG